MKSLSTFFIVLASLVTALVLSACAASEDDRQAARDEARLAVAREMIRTWNERQWDQMYEMFTEDGVLHSMMLDPLVGRDTIRERLAPMTTGIEQIELQISHMGVVGDVVMIERVDDFVFNGKHGRVPVVGVMEIEGDKVKVWREYYDHAMLMDAMAPDEPAVAQGQAAVEAKVRELTAKLQSDWNAGDMAGYLNAYWKDDDMSLMFGDQAVRGWDNLNELFSGNWTTEEAMGDFYVNDAEVRFPNENIAIVSGPFEHHFPELTVIGAFSHVWQKTDKGEWVIVHEHTSRKNPE